MTFAELLNEKDLTIYKLSKESGVAKTTLFDIASGKSNILDCTARNLLKISNALNVSIEDLIKLDPTIYNPVFERNVPEFLLDNIENIKKAKRRKSSLLDCYLDEANSSINVCEVENLISKEQADYLRKKYLR